MDIAKCVSLSSHAVIKTETFSSLTIYKVVSQDILDFLRKIALTSTDMSLVCSINQFLEGISFTKDGIALTENSLDAILTLTNTSHRSKIVRKNFFLKAKGFFVFLLPIAIPIIYEQCLRNIDTESERIQQMQNTQYQEQHLIIENQKLDELRKQSTYLEQISDSLEALQEDSTYFEDIATDLHLFLGKYLESHNTDLEAADESACHDADR